MLSVAICIYIYRLYLYMYISIYRLQDFRFFSSIAPKEKRLNEKLDLNQIPQGFHTGEE